MLWYRKRKKEMDRVRFEYQCRLAKESERYHQAIDELRRDINEALKPCVHTCKNPSIMEIGFRQEYNKDENSCDSIVIYGEVGLCEKCYEFYRRKYEKVVERTKCS